MTDFLQHKIFKLVSDIAEQEGVRAFAIGGYVRDCLLGRDSKDIDIVIEGSGINMAEEVAKKLRVSVNIFKHYGTAMLHCDGMDIEFVGARKESYNPDSRKPIVENGTLEDDQRRRDFTINALAFSLQKEEFGKLIDPFGGTKDLQEGLLRTPLDPDITYSDDPLRMMRAVRFATQLGFTIVPESFEAIKRNKHRMQAPVVSIERIVDELNKIMKAEKPSKGFFLLEETDLLALFLPQLSKLRGVEIMEGRGHKDNFSHTLQVLDNVAAKSDKLWLRWAALLHDIAKPTTKRYDPVLGWTFHAHEFIGAKMIPCIFKQLRLPLSDNTMKYVQKMVQLHLRPIALSLEDVTDSAVRRLLFDAGDDIDDLMLLCKADITSKNEQTVQRHLRNFEIVREKLIEVEAKDAVRNFQPPITGEIIMRKYNIPPCREIGLIKETIKNAILDGLIRNDYDEAYALMEQKAKEMGLTNE
ncbi:MAG: CCA tRNA nucleotidyltransferase [Bacteroidales bacterium]|nr:CCA tRNA nucleotidyltransferase [Bacteroidales bacterium]MCL2133720.1 CCA tRNA nucleotidyltransferase [Bacteroidales bacterium]